VRGDALLGDGAIVEIDGTPAPTGAVADNIITLALPAGLAAGPHALQVRQGVVIGGAPPRPAFASGLASFSVQPFITKTAGTPDIAITNVGGVGAAPRSATINVGVSPAVGVSQIATLEMLSAGQLAFRFLAQPLAAPGAQLPFQASGLAAGDYLFRVTIDGAASPLDLDGAGAPIGPKATIP
jgi:hypothetical protein